jgi:23S rRNA pseudouridine1911/1915/1917 synthase
MNKYLVKTDSTLMEFLLNHYNKKNVKNLLKFKQVSVNGQVISQFDYSLKRDDEIVVDRNPNNNSSLDIIYEDRELIVINKPAGLLSMAGGNEKEKIKMPVFLLFIDLIKKHRGYCCLLKMK